MSTSSQSSSSKSSKSLSSKSSFSSSKSSRSSLSSSLSSSSLSSISSVSPSSQSTSSYSSPSSLSSDSSFSSSPSSNSSHTKSSHSSLSFASNSSSNSSESSSTINEFTSSESSLSSSFSSVIMLSSSSSSLFDKNDSKLIPFVFSSNKDKTIYSMAFYGNYVFAATSDSGMVIRSLNRYEWENFYQTDDTLVTSVHVKGDSLFIGTAPNAKIYKINLKTYKVTNYSSLFGKTVAFAELNNEFYLFTSLPSNVYKYDKLYDKWDVFYKPYSGEINQVKVLNGKIYLACKGENVISFDGSLWKVEINTASAKSVPTSLFSHSTYNFIDTKSIIGTDNIDKEVVLDVFPYNRAIGIKSLSSDGGALLMGAMNKGRVYSYYDGKVDVIFDTEGKKVHDLLNIDSASTLASIDNKLYLIYCVASGVVDDFSSFSSLTQNVAGAEALSSQNAENGGGNFVPQCNGIPILELPPDENITFMTKDKLEGVLFATSKGRVLSCDKKMFNAYLTGERTIYAEAWDGYDNVSQLTRSNFMYALYNRISEITQDKEIVKTRFFPVATPYACDKITAEFVSPILYVKQDMGLWKELIWEEYKPSNCDITVCIRTADTSDGLKSASWKYCFQSNISETGVISRPLNNINIKGQYMQLRVEMTSHSNNLSPMVANVSVKYSTKKSYYFFTEKFSLEKGTDIKNGIMVANMTKPINTEINFGITSSNSADWNDYETIEPEKLFSVKNYKNVKVGIKLISYDENVPSVDEFSLIFGDDKKQIIQAG